MLAERNCHWC